MKTPSPLVTWIPPFVVGLSAAVAGELAVGLLLYSTPGFLRALTLILAVLLGSLALGLWTSLPPSEERYTESLRRRWLLTLIAFAGGSAVSGAWSLQRGLAGDVWSRGGGLALLAALPLYACGTLLGAMPSRRWPWARRIPVGASATAGAALGTVLAGYVLISWLLPVSIYAFCLVLLSGGALAHGLILTATGERRVLLAVPSPFGRVRIEEWTWGRKVPPVRIMLENERVRGAEDVDGKPARPWEVAALDLMSRALEAVQPSANGSAPPAEEPPTETISSADDAPSSAAFSDHPEDAPPSARVLVLGGGMFTLARQVLGRYEAVSVDVTERNPAIVAVGQEHLTIPEHPRLRVFSTDPLASLEPLSGPYDVTLVDGSGLPFADPVPLFGQSWLEELKARIAEKGIVMLGGIERGRATGLPLEQLLMEGGRLFPAVGLYAARTEPGPVSRTTSVGETSVRPGEFLLVFSPDPTADFPADLEGLTLESVRRSALERPTEERPSEVERAEPAGEANATDLGSVR